MASNSFRTYPGDGTTRLFSVGFPYLSRAHVGAQVDGVPVTFTFQSDTAIQLDVAPPIGTTLVIRRRTPADTPAVTFTDSGLQKAADLNTASRQSLYVAQELIDEGLAPVVGAAQEAAAAATTAAATTADNRAVVEETAATVAQLAADVAAASPLVAAALDQSAANAAQTTSDRIAVASATQASALNAANAQTGTPNRPAVRLIFGTLTGGAFVPAALPAHTYNNSAGTITMTAAGVLAADGKAIAFNDVVLVCGDGAKNGAYVCTTAGASGVAAVLTRRSTENTASTLGLSCWLVTDGATLAGWSFRIVEDGASITLGTTPLSVVPSNNTAGVAGANAALNTFKTAVSSALTQVPKPAATALVGENAYNLTNGSYSWAIGIVGGVDVTSGTLVDGFRVPLAVGEGAVAVALRLWSRPIGAAWALQPPGYSGTPGDVLVASATSSVAALGLTAGQGDLVSAYFSFAEVVVAADTMYYVEIEALDSGGTRVISAVPYHLVSGLTTDQYRKFRRAGASTSWSNQVTSTNFRYAYELTRVGFSVPEDVRVAKLVPSNIADRIDTATAAWNGTGVSVAGTAVRLGASTPFSGTLTLDTATGGSVTDEPITLTAAGGGAKTFSYLTNKTAHANLRSVVVKDAGTGAVLVKDTDYWILEEPGAMSLAGTSGTARNVLVSYAWSDRRYDLVVYTPLTGSLSVIKGVERVRDASEFIPTAPAGTLPICTVHYRYPTPTVTTVWDVEDGVRRASRAEADAETVRNRRILRKVLKKLRAGQPVTGTSYADSNLAQMGGGYTLAAIRSAANTVYHDRTKDSGGLLRNPPYGFDVLSAIPTYDTGDGAGAVHTKFGAMWELIRAMEDGYSSTITYRNRSIPGSNSSNANYQGLDSVRLAAATDEAPDFVVICFGQNELGATTTRANIIAICQAFQAVGTIPIVLGCFRPNADDLHASHTTANWLYTQRALREAAYAADAAYVSTEFLYSASEIGALGVSTHDHCAATLDVHPGPREVRLIGKRLAAWLD